MGRQNFYGMKAGDFVAYKRPADVGAPYSAAIVLPDGRHYEGRLCNHPMREGDAFWYVGFVVAMDPIVYARDEDLKRYPVAPVLEPKQWNLLPLPAEAEPLPFRIRELSAHRSHR